MVQSSGSGGLHGALHCPGAGAGAPILNGENANGADHAGVKAATDITPARGGPSGEACGMEFKWAAEIEEGVWAAADTAGLGKPPLPVLGTGVLSKGFQNGPLSNSPRRVVSFVGSFL